MAETTNRLHLRTNLAGIPRKTGRDAETQQRPKSSPVMVKNRIQRQIQRQQRSKANENSALFKKLPAELRNRIYELAIGEEEVVEITGVGFIDPDWGGPWIANMATNHKINRQLQLAITQTCQQMRYETVEILYARSTFLIYSFDRAKAMRWARSLSPESVMALSSIMISSKNDRCTCDCFVLFRFEEGRETWLKRWYHKGWCDNQVLNNAGGFHEESIYVSGEEGLETAIEKLGKIFDVFAHVRDQIRGVGRC